MFLTLKKILVFLDKCLKFLKWSNWNRNFQNLSLSVSTPVSLSMPLLSLYTPPPSLSLFLLSTLSLFLLTSLFLLIGLIRPKSRFREDWASHLFTSWVSALLCFAGACLFCQCCNEAVRQSTERFECSFLVTNPALQRLEQAVNWLLFRASQKHILLFAYLAEKKTKCINSENPDRFHQGQSKAVGKKWMLNRVECEGEQSRNI